MGGKSVTTLPQWPTLNENITLMGFMVFMLDRNITRQTSESKGKPKIIIVVKMAVYEMVIYLPGYVHGIIIFVK